MKMEPKSWPCLCGRHTSVTVKERRWLPGVRRFGGVAILTAHHQDGTYALKFLMGGTEKSVEGQYLSCYEPENGPRQTKRHREPSPAEQPSQKSITRTGKENGGVTLSSSIPEILVVDDDAGGAVKEPCNIVSGEAAICSCEEAGTSHESTDRSRSTTKDDGKQTDMTATKPSLASTLRPLDIAKQAAASDPVVAFPSSQGTDKNTPSSPQAFPKNSAHSRPEIRPHMRHSISDSSQKCTNENSAAAKAEEKTAKVIASSGEGAAFSQSCQKSQKHMSAKRSTSSSFSLKEVSPLRVSPSKGNQRASCTPSDAVEPDKELQKESTDAISTQEQQGRHDAFTARLSCVLNRIRGDSFDFKKLMPLINEVELFKDQLGFFGDEEGMAILRALEDQNKIMFYNETIYKV